MERSGKFIESVHAKISRAIINKTVKVPSCYYQVKKKTIRHVTYIKNLSKRAC